MKILSFYFKFIFIKFLCFYHVVDKLFMPDRIYFCSKCQLAGMRLPQAQQAHFPTQQSCTRRQSGRLALSACWSSSTRWTAPLWTHWSCPLWWTASIPRFGRSRAALESAGNQQRSILVPRLALWLPSKLDAERPTRVESPLMTSSLSIVSLQSCSLCVGTTSSHARTSTVSTQRSSVTTPTTVETWVMNQ